MDFDQKTELVDALTECSAIKNDCETVVSNLPKDIRDTIQKANNSRIYVTNIVTKCLEHKNGLKKLVKIVGYFERDSIPMQKVYEVISGFENHAVVKPEQAEKSERHAAVKPEQVEKSDSSRREPCGEKKKIFISYARQDLEIAKKLHDDLKSKGMEPWLDKEKILPGQNWKILISKAIKECNYFLALLSTNSVSKNGFVRKELKIALEIYNNYSPEDVFIIPARINECEPVDERLQYLQWADLFPSYETGMEQILRVLLPEETAGNELPDEKQNQKQKERVIKTEKAPAEIKYPRRKDPVKVSKGEFIKVFGLDGNRRPLEYIPNEYKDNEDGTVTDYATGLMWQQSGSDGYINYKQAQKYIQELNSNRFAGYDDWRLPTIDELISLLEPEKKSGDLYIDPIFDTKQRWCWSSDIESSSVAWGVYFSFGNVDLYNLYNYYYVRGVRPRQ